MGTGDVTVNIIAAPFTTGSIDTIVTAMRVTVNDKWLMAGLDDQIVIVHIEEAP